MIDRGIFLVPDNGTWRFPEGKIDDFESYEQAAERILKNETGIHPNPYWSYTQINPENTLEVQISSQREPFTGLCHATTTKIYGIFLSDIHFQESLFRPHKHTGNLILVSQLIKNGEAATEIASDDGKLHQVSSDVTRLAKEHLKQISSLPPSINAAALTDECIPLFAPQILLKALKSKVTAPQQKSRLKSSNMSLKVLNRQLLEQMK